jgi:dGTPase
LLVAERYSRFHDRPEEHAKDRRSPARRDRDRILYSSAFRRLSGITQVVAPTERHPIHNRLTHSLEVAQIGRSIAEDLLRDTDSNALAASLGGLDPDVVEAAALAHDLGHPPFGHVTEMELDDLMKNGRGVADGFEGNAQSFRIVTTLAVRYPDIAGLNLTRATLNAMLKYPWLRGTTGIKARKWGAYGSEQPQFAWARALMPAGSESKGLEAELMDWSDDVAYAVHDMEDFFRAGLIPLDRLASDSRERERFLAAETARHAGRFNARDLQDAFNFVMSFSPIFEPYQGKREDRARVRSFTSGLIDRYVSAVALNPAGDSARPLIVDERARMEVTMLKSLTWHYVIESRSLTAQRFGQRALIRSLFDILCNAASSADDWHVFPEFYQDALADARGDDERIARAVADLISSMAETQLIGLHQRISGNSLGSALDPIIA